MMKRRTRATLAALALMALAVLLFRPVMLDSIGSPFGVVSSPEVQFAYADASPHCGMLADCETVSVVTTGLAVSVIAGLLVLAGIVRPVRQPSIRVLHSWTVQVPVPPPLSTLS